MIAINASISNAIFFILFFLILNANKKHNPKTKELNINDRSHIVPAELVAAGSVKILIRLNVTNIPIKKKMVESKFGIITNRFNPLFDQAKRSPQNITSPYRAGKIEQTAMSA